MHFTHGGDYSDSADGYADLSYDDADYPHLPQRKSGSVLRARPNGPEFVYCEDVPVVVV